MREHRQDQDYPPGDAYKYAEITGGFPFLLRGKKVEERLAEIIDGSGGFGADTHGTQHAEIGEACNAYSCLPRHLPSLAETSLSIGSLPAVSWGVVRILYKASQALSC